jgi:hypothetical protein
MPRKSKRLLPGKRYPLNMRTTKELRDKIENAAMASGRSLVQEVEFRLERSFQQQEIEKELMARLDVQGDEILKRMRREMQELGEAMRREMGLPEENYDAPRRPSLLDLVGDTEGPSEQPKGGSGQPDDTSKPSTTEDDSGGKQ